MFFELTHPLPKKCYIACSGGVDSISALHFLHKRVVGVLHFHHGTSSADKFLSHTRSVAKSYGIPFLSSYLFKPIPKGCISKEQWWRDQRYNFLNSYASADIPVVLAHNLNDCLEEYLMNVLVRGRQGTIPYRNGNCIRPFRMWPKEEIYSFAGKNSLLWVEDPSNKDVKFRRNNIRHGLIGKVLELNPGLYSIVKKQVFLQDKFSGVENV